MATYDSIHTGEQVDEAVDIVLNNKNKGSNVQPIYLDAYGEAKNVNVDAAPTQDSQNLVQSGGVFTQLSTKYAKADISTDDNLGTSNVLIPSQGAVKTYVDNKLATKQDVVIAGDGIVKDGNTLSISTDNDFMTVGKLDNKWNHFSSTLDMGYGTEIIEKIEAAKHSTFDRSKFTVVGSPVITDDGIASGFSDSNYVKTNFTFDSSKPFEINFEFEPVVAASNTSVFSLVNPSWREMFYYRCSDSGSMVVQHYDGNHYSAAITIQVSMDKGCLWRVESDGTNISCSVLQDGTVLGSFSDLISKFSSTTFGVGAYVVLGTGFYLSAYTGTIDLKQFSIITDGVPSFNGNKTGIDTIKADDYTVVGTPTISADGVASGFSTANYIKTTISNFTSSSVWKGTARVKLPTELPATAPTILYISGGASALYFQLNIQKSSSSLNINVYAYDGTTVGTATVNVTSYMGQYVDIKYEVSNAQRKLDVYTTDGTLIGSNTNTNTLTWQGFNTDKNCLFGTNGVNEAYSSSIDLNAFKIYVDGNLVYQPCLKIPYTQTKDGKKIVDYQYRSRVEDEYVQGGFTPYYTLDTESRGDYQVVGSPTISSDWIASGFTRNNVLYTTYCIPKGTPNFILDVGLITGTNLTSQDLLLPDYNGSAGFFLQIENNRFTLYNVDSNSHWYKIMETSANYVQANTKYCVRIIQDATKVKLYIGSSFNSLSFIDDSDSLITFVNSYDFYRLQIGARRTVGTPFEGSMDLKEFKIYVDNKLTYQAVIPPNYTMATVKESAIVDSYDNGMNKYTKYANLTCKQQGSCTSGTAVTFTKSYTDTNYALSVPYSAKTKTGFTPSATGDWITNGKVNLNA